MFNCTFGDAIENTRRLLRDYGKEVQGTHWQSMDITHYEEQGYTREVLDIHHQILMLTEDLDYYRGQIKPNLPWADDHFLERIRGLPLNPGKEWAKWPYAHAANRHRKEQFGDGPLLSPSVWRYVAAYFEISGKVVRRSAEANKDNNNLIRIQIERGGPPDALEKIKNALGAGILVKSSRSNVMNGKKYTSHTYRLDLSRQKDISWILTNILPFVTNSKRADIQSSLKGLKERFENPASQGPGFKRVWGRDWEPRFSHTYMQRFWPHYDDGERPTGIMGFKYGDLNDVISLLYKQPLTRQAYLPVWFPEDTGVVHGERVPCTLGYHFILREGKLHCTYSIRSCDFVRHYRDDLYLAVRLTLHVLDRLRLMEETDVMYLNAPKSKPSMGWRDIKPGRLVFNCTSMHCFNSDWAQVEDNAIPQKTQAANE